MMWIFQDLMSPIHTANMVSKLKADTMWSPFATLSVVSEIKPRCLLWKHRAKTLVILGKRECSRAVIRMAAKR